MFTKTLTAEELKSVIFRNDDIVILSGAPGCGKSTFVKGKVTFSADHYMLDDKGNYSYNVKKLGDCHATCFRMFLCNLQAHAYNNPSYEPIFVDNTNGSVEEIVPYYLAAKAFNRPVVIVTWLWMPRTIEENRNIHNVLLERVQKKAIQIWERRIPNFWDCTHYIVN